MVEPDGINGPLPPVPALVTTPVNLSSADVTVSMAGPVTATAGTNIIHTITVLNDGPSAATSVSLFDAVPPGLTQVSVTGACSALPCSLGSMANDETRTVSVTYAIPVNYSGADPIVNRASVTTASEDIFPNNNSASVSTALRASVADLVITNTNGVEGVVVGTPTTYTITVTNAGPATAADAVVTDIFPSALTGVSWSCAGTGGAVCGAAAGTGNINATVTVPVAGAATFTATGTVDSATSNTIENTARVVPAAGTSDPTQAIATDIDPIELRADLSVTQTGPATVVAGNHITYTLTVHNAGPSADENVLLEELVPLELTFVSATGPCTAFPCSLATLAAGATVSLEVTYAVPDIYLPDTVVSAARVSSSTVDPNEINNTSTTTATVARDADVEILKQISPDTTSLLGEDATFFVTVTNHGPAPATGIVVKDLLPAGLTLVSAHVSQGSYVPQTGLWIVGTLEDEAFATLTLISTLDVVDSITNLAQVLQQNEPDPVSSNNVSSAILNGQAERRRRGEHHRRQAGAVGGRKRDLHGGRAEQRPEPRDRSRRRRLLSAGLTLVTATPSQGTFVGAGLDHRRAERDCPSGHADDRGDRHCARPPGQCRDRHAADGRGFESGQQPRQRRAQCRRVRQSEGGQDAHAIVATRRGTADVQRDCGQPGPESGDGRPGHGGVVGRALFRVGSPVAGLVRQRDRHLDGRIDRECRQRGLDDHGARHAGGHGHQHRERHRQRSTGS